MGQCNPNAEMLRRTPWAHAKAALKCLEALVGQLKLIGKGIGTAWANAWISIGSYYILCGPIRQAREGSTVLLMGQCDPIAAHEMGPCEGTQIAYRLPLASSSSSGKALPLQHGPIHEFQSAVITYYVGPFGNLVRASIALLMGQCIPNAEILRRVPWAHAKAALKCLEVPVGQLELIGKGIDFAAWANP
jgi:hypothetical protein